ncbi:hypothetical protein HNY73_013522 [Argiope bruennichi]|uniref:Uncharacterized protein n=1 Tax=Argiope bruennichi TaxID=94029 RepID=A0A8T0F363_ARGBR|nr:hypothetical protein HNY73_013522 [Argiope bruennichi]
MWKKMSRGLDKSRKNEEASKHKKLKFTKKEPFCNNKHSPYESKKSSTRQPEKSKALVPLKVSVVPASLKGALKSENKKTIGNKRVSFDCDPEIRYRTASDTSSNSTLKSLKVVTDSGPKADKKQNSIGMLMATNKNSETEKKFDDLINDKCSWTYKSIKTIKCETSRKNNIDRPIVKIRTTNIEETAYNHGSSQNGATCLSDEYDNIDADIKKTSHNSKTLKHNSMKGNRPTKISDERTLMSAIRTRNRRTLKAVDYAESNSESIQSSSDEGLIFLSRIYDDKMLNDPLCINSSDKIKIPKENSLKVGADERDYNNAISKANFLKNHKASNNQNFKSQSYDEVNEMENNSNQGESKPCFEDQNDEFDLLFDDDYQKSNLTQISLVNSSLQKTDLSLSEVLSLQSECDNSEFEETTENNKPAKSNLDSEILQKYRTTSTEVQSVCDQLETPNDDEIVRDFFSGNFNVDKYRSKINIYKSTSIITEKNENNSSKSKFPGKTIPDDSLETYSKGGIHSTEKSRKCTNRNLDNTKDIKGKLDKSDNKINFNFENKRNSVNLKEQHFDSDQTSSGQGIEDKINDGSSAKCTKKTPKTWEDLEADILNRNEQIFFFLQPETGEAFLKDKKQIEIGENGLNFNKSKGNFGTANKWGNVKSKQENSEHLASSKNLNNDDVLHSPNASIIHRVIQKMQQCTSPVLTPSKSEKHQESPLLSEYSYSVQETKSVFTIEKKLNEKQTEQSKTISKAYTAKSVKQKNYRFNKRHDTKSVLDSPETRIINQISGKLDEISREKNKMFSKCLMTDNDNLHENNKISEMDGLTSEPDKYPLLPQDFCSNVNGSYNLRKRKLINNTYNATKKQTITKVINLVENNSINEYKRNNQDKQKVIQKPSREKPGIENFELKNKKKIVTKSDFMNSFTDESEPEDLFQNEELSMTDITDKKIRCEGKSKDHRKTTEISNKRMSSQTNTHLASGKTKSPDQSLQKQGYSAKKLKEANRPKEKCQRNDSKKEYEKYLKTLFSSNIQREFLNSTSENTEKKGNISYSNAQKFLCESSDEEFFSLSSDTEFEDVKQPFPRRASGLLDEIFD